MAVRKRKLKTSPDYWIYEDGRVFSVIKNRFLKPRKHSHGYLRIQISGKDKYIHRLVAECFIKKEPWLTEINHKNGRKEDNSVENLEWSNRSLNNKHAFASGLRSYSILSEMGKIGGLKKRIFSMTDVEKIKNIWASKKHTQQEIAKMFNCSRGSISGIVYNVSYQNKKSARLITEKKQWLQSKI